MMITRCETVQPELKAYIDGALNPITMLQVKRHLAACEACRRELAMVKRIGKELQSMDIAALGSADSDALAPDLRARILAAIPTEPPVTNKSSQFPLRLSGRPMLAIGAAAAAVVVGLIFLPRGRSRQLAPDSEIAGSSSVASNKAAHVPAPAAGSAGGFFGGDGVAGDSARSAMTKSEVNQPNVSIQDGHQFRGSVSAAPMAPTNAAGSPTNEPTAMDSLAGGSPARLQAGASFGSRSTVTRPSVSHTFVAQNLADGEKSISRTALDFGGSVSTAGGINDGAKKSIELIVTLPASSAASLIEAIPSRSAGAVREETVTQVSQPASLNLHDGHMREVPKSTTSNLRASGTLLQSPAAFGGQEQHKLVDGERGSGRTARRTPSGVVAGEKAEAGKQFAKGRAQAMATVTIKLVKGR